MSISLNSLTTKIRALIDDNSQSIVDPYTYNTSDVFTLTEGNVITVSKLSVNDVDYGDSNWEYSSGEVTLLTNSGISTGDSIKISYTHYSNYSDTQIENYERAALIHISVNNVKEFIVEGGNIYPEPTDSEENLICLLTSILIEPNNATIRMPDFTIVVPNDLPTDRKISKYIAIYKKDSHGVFGIA